MPAEAAALGRRRSRAEQVAIAVEDEILAARLPVGARLGRRAEFMTRFRISPTIMNETLRILRDRGLVGVRPGTGGGVFVASLPPQVRLGAIDLWFTNLGSTHPLELFEARLHLEAQLTPVAFDRATHADIALMQQAHARMADAVSARPYLDAIWQLHRTLVRAARIPVLDGMHESVVTLLRATLSRADFVDGHAELVRHSVDVHGGIVEAIRDRNRSAFDKIMQLHDADLIRSDDPGRSPSTPSAHQQ